MAIIINNNTCTILNADDKYITKIHKAMSYRDKSVDFRVNQINNKIKFMTNRNPMFVTSSYYSNLIGQLEELKKSSKGSMLSIISNNGASFPTGLLSMIDLSQFNVTDNRCDTGVNIALPWHNKLPDLRDYQEEGVKLIENNRRGLLNLATGLGKTFIAIHAVRRVQKKALILVPTKTIAQQFLNDLEQAFGSHRVGMLGGGKNKLKDVNVAIVASAINHIEQLKNLDLGLVIFDEVHRIAASTFFTVAQELGHVGKMFGLTATDFRSDGKDIMIEAGVGETIMRRDIRWGIDNGWLAKPHFIVRKVDVKLTDASGKNMDPKDKMVAYKTHVLGNTVLRNLIESDAKGFIERGHSVLILVDEIVHGEELSRKLNIPFAKGDDDDSSSYIKSLNDKKIPALVATEGKVGEGVDTKSITVLILVNFTVAKGPVIQAIGRGLRKVPGKDACIIIDYDLINSTILSRHAKSRISYYKEITNSVTII